MDFDSYLKRLKKIFNTNEDITYADIENFRYVNGNYLVVGEKSYVRETVRLKKMTFRFGEELNSAFPDSIDLKISNKCSWGCPFCHESSKSTGKTFNIENTKKILSELPQVPIEIAIGGGNVLETPELTLEFLKWIIKDTQFLPRITINYNDVVNYSSLSKKQKEVVRDIFMLIRYVGISLTNIPKEYIEYKNITREGTGLYTGYGRFASFIHKTVENTLSAQVIFHVILGIIPVKDLEELLNESGCYVLILGYKQWGRAKDSELPDFTEYKKLINSYISNDKKEISTISFDNLAIEQLDLKSSIPENIWEGLYLGDEGKHSMYIDAVEETYAKTSRSKKRVSWKDMGLIEFFNKQKDDKLNF